MAPEPLKAKAMNSTTIRKKLPLIEARIEVLELLAIVIILLWGKKVNINELFALEMK